MFLGVLKNWIWLQRTQWMKREELERIQAEKLQETVIQAYKKVPFYSRLYRAANAPLSDIKQIDDISKLPTIARADLQKAPLQDRTAIGVDARSCRVIKSSGTSGAPISTLEDPYSATYREALMLRFLWAYGVRPLDKIVRGRYWTVPARAQTTIHLTENPGLWRFLRHRILEDQYFTNFKDQYQFLLKCKADVLVASVYYCRQLAKHCERAGKSLSFRMVLTSGDIIDDSTRRVIADSFGAEVFDNYGIEEVGGSVAWECAQHYGYHVNSESLVVEFLRDGHPVAAGESGDVYLSCFHRKATPILRYFTGDRARRVDDDCPCGRGLHLIREIEGRTMDFIVTSNGGYVSPHIVLLTLTHINGVEQFKVSQNKNLSIEIRIKTHKNRPEQIIHDVQQHCKRLFNRTPLDVKLVDRIYTVGPKFRIVESQATR